MNIDPRHLKAVLAIVEHGTFNKASDALGMCQPALSKSISQLEKRLGVRLFDRTARGSTLTQAGHIVARRAEGLDLLLSRLQEEIRTSIERLDGPLEIAAVPSLMLGLVPEALRRTLAINPRLIANVTEGLDDALTPALQRGALDLLICPLDGQAPPDDLLDVELSSEPLFVAVSRTHRLADANQLSLHELRDEAWVLPRAGGSFHRMVEALFIAADIPWPRQAVFTDRLHIHGTLLAGAQRVAIVTATHLVGSDAGVAAIPLAGAPRRRLGLRRRRAVKLHPMAEIFATHVADVASELALRWNKRPE